MLHCYKTSEGVTLRAECGADTALTSPPLPRPPAAPPTERRDAPAVKTYSLLSSPGERPRSLAYKYLPLTKIFLNINIIDTPTKNISHPVVSWPRTHASAQITGRSPGSGADAVKSHVQTGAGSTS